MSLAEQPLTLRLPIPTQPKGSILNAERIVGMMSLAQLQWLADETRNRSNIVEIGCYRGRTTTAFCENCPGTVTAVDTWGGSPGLMEAVTFMQDAARDPDWLFHEFLRNMQPFPNLQICRASSLQAAGRFGFDIRNGTRPKFDFVFVDALHDFASVQADIMAWFPLIEPSGMMCGHDFQFPDVQKAVLSIFPDINMAPDADFWVITVEA